MTTSVIKTANGEARVAQGAFTGADQTEAIQVTGGIVVQFTGASTAVNAIVERSTVDPQIVGTTPNWARVDDDPITGNPSTGMTTLEYKEPAIAWWRVRIVSTTGTVFASISGSTGV